MFLHTHWVYLWASEKAAARGRLVTSRIVLEGLLASHVPCSVIFYLLRVEVGFSVSVPVNERW